MPTAGTRVTEHEMQLTQKGMNDTGDFARSFDAADASVHPRRENNPTIGILMTKSSKAYNSGVRGYIVTPEI